MRTRIFFIFFFLSFGCLNPNQGEVQDDTSDISYGREKLTVILSFDYEGFEGGHEEDLDALFGLIDRHNATATFFIMGRKAEIDPGDVMQMHRRNYSLGLHTYYHKFPIFKIEDADLIADVYNESTEREWERSFKTKEAFYRDIIQNRKVVMMAVENAVSPKMFRGPSLTINWTRDPTYFDALKRAGIEIDSSIHQDFNNPRPFYYMHGVLEVPVVASEKRLDKFQKFVELARACARAGVPLVLYLHPKNMDSDKIKALDRYLHTLETEYKVTYLRVEEVPNYYTS